MGSGKRTWIRNLRVEGYRSLQEISLENLDPIVVLHGPNGCGKSNLLRAAKMILRWAARKDKLPSLQNPLRLRKLDPLAQKRHLLQASDFSQGQRPEMRIHLEVELGEFQKDWLGEEAFERLILRAVAQDQGESLALWFEEARLDDLPLEEADNSKERNLLELSWDIERIESEIRGQEFMLPFRLSSSFRSSNGPKTENQILELKSKLREKRQEKEKQEKEASREELSRIRAKSLLLPRLLLHTPAYRSERSNEAETSDEYEIRLLENHELMPSLVASVISPDRQRRSISQQLSLMLRQAGFEQDGLAPAFDEIFQEFRIYFTDSAGAERSLDQMGTGKQQMFWMLGRLHMNPSAVVMLEEPEAHLHKDMILPLASYFLKAVEPRRDNGDEKRPMIDQLWLETHHHAFAIQSSYLDVSLQDGWTRVEKKLRSRAAEHFYEPGPFFSALRQLVGSIVEKESVLFRDPSGQPITAQMLQDSIDGNRTLANQYANAMTEAAVLSMARKARKATG